MYDNPQNGQAADTATPETEAAKVNGLRNLILELLFGSAVITAKEWATAVERTANTQNLDTLAKWYQNTVAEIGHREAAAQAVTAYATTEQKMQIVRLLNHPAVSRPRKSKELVRLAYMTEAQAVALLAELTTLTTTPPTRPAGAGVTVNRRGQLTVATLTRYVGKGAAAAGGVSLAYGQAA